MEITETAPPPESLIAPYAARAAHYVDCFETPRVGAVTLPEFITAFYNQPLFRAERIVLRFAAGARSRDEDVAALADGRATQFAVWAVKDRREDEILMMDKAGRTCSWLQTGEGVLRFGSVVVPVPGRRGTPTLGPVFQSLLGAHKVYSRALLAGAVRRLG